MIQLKVYKDGQHQLITAQKGENLRHVLLRHGLSPYTKLTRQMNCGGNGLCATCGVFITEGEPPPRHWHDKLAARFRYPRLSCQVIIDHNMVIEIPSKLIWGNRRPKNK